MKYILKNINRLSEFIINKKNIALFSGSFNPPHCGHMKAVKSALNHCADAVLIFPHSHNRSKQTVLAPIENRVEMLTIILKHSFRQDKNLLQSVKIIDHQFLHGYKNERTLGILKDMMHDDHCLYILSGSDVPRSFPKTIDNIKHLPHLIFKRKDDDLENVKQSIYGDITILNDECECFSSSEIRNNLKKGNDIPDCEPLNEYIKKHKIYSDKKLTKA